MPSLLKSEASSNPVQIEIPVLPYRILGKTGIKTPLISLGAGNVNNSNFIKASYHAGIKLFFSATYYGEGNNEILVGEALKGLPRDSFVVGTAASPDGLDRRSGLLNEAFSVEAYMKKAEESLKRFGLDHIDILLFPYAGKKETVLHEGILKTMEQLNLQYPVTDLDPKTIVIK